MSKKIGGRAIGALSVIMVLAVAAFVESAAAGRTTTLEAQQSRVIPPQSAWPRTRAEISGYTVTSSHADVIAFIDSLRRLGAQISTGSIGKTAQGRDLPYVIASRPLVSTPAEARALNRPIIYVEANIHSGEVEGKEAIQALVRDLVFSPSPNALDSVVLIAIPNYNADGNENLAPQARARGSQNGPEMVGTRNTSEPGQNLNRDFMRAFAPETRATLSMFNEWDPHVFVDLHTSNGSMHGYALTYSPPLNPASVHTIPFSRDLLAEIRQRMRDRHDFETFDYGNWGGNCSPNCSWRTYSHTPRYGTNYYGLRGRIAILSEAFSHDPFERRVKSTYAFVSEILSTVAAKGSEVQALARRADSLTVAWGRNPSSAPPIAVRSVMTASPFKAPVLVAEVVSTPGDTTVYEAGLGRGRRKTGRVEAQEMNIHDRFDASLSRPFAYGYALDSTQSAAVERLRLHGVQVQRLGQELANIAVEAFRIDAVQRTGNCEGFPCATFRGTWQTSRRTLPRGSYFVPMSQPLAILALYLLEPESDDGLGTWMFFDSSVEEGRDFPALRVAQPVDTAR